MTKFINNNSRFFTVFPGIYISVALVFDWLTPFGMVTPFFVVLGLLFMALYYRPRVMIPWAITYTVIICSIILIPKLFIIFSGHPYREAYIIPVLRAATYSIVSGLSCHLCIALNRLRKSEKELTTVLANLPWPILTSDQYGKIIYWNVSTEALLPSLCQREGVHNYFDLLAPPEFHSRTITEYLKRLERDPHEEPLKLSVNGRPVKGHTQIIEWTDKKVLLTILSEEGTVSPSIPRLA